MRLVRIKLHNICQFESLDWEFGDGMVGIFGPNGAGKSNAALVVPYMALTGLYTRHSLGKAGMLKYGADSGKIELTIACHGQPLKITIDFKAKANGEPTVKAQLEYDDNGKPAYVTGPTAVFDKLRTTFGIDAAMLNKYVLVEQQSLHSLLVGDRVERLKALGRLCGTDRAEVVYDALSKQHTLLSNTIQGMNFAKDDTEAALREAKQNARQAKRKYTAKASRLLDSEIRKQLETFASARRLRKEAIAALTAKRDRKTRLDAEVTELAQQSEAAAETAKAWHRRTCRRKKRYLAAKMVFDTLKATRESAIEYRQLRKALDEAKTLAAAPAPKQVALKASRTQVQHEAETLRDRIRDAQRLLDATDGVERCPVCSTPTTKLKDIRQDAERDIPVWTAKHDRIRLELEKYDAYVMQHNRWAADVEDAQQDVKRLTQSLGKLKVPPKKLPDTAEARAAAVRAKDAYVSAKLAYSKHREQASDLKVRHAGLEGEQRQLAVEIAQAEKALPSKVTAEAAKDARQQLSRDDRRQEVVDQLKTAYIEARTLRQAAQTAHDKAEAVRLRHAKLLEWQARLERCRDYMHRNGLPKSIHAAALGLLEERINPILEELGATFVAHAHEDDASLYVRMPGGEEFPAQALSGGQTCSLSIAYRLAVKETFASHFDTLVLDEPTAGLDTRRMDCLVEFLTRVRRRAKRTGQQIIIVSHSDRLRPVFDKILEVD